MENTVEIKIKKRHLALFAFLLVLLVAGGISAYSFFSSRNASDGALPAPLAADIPAIGPADALVTIEEFSDFQCPFCARSVQTLKQVLNEFPGQVRLIFRHFPVAESHPDAPLVHMATLAAGRQGRFWEMHDVVFENQKRVRGEDLLGYARDLGLNMDAFRASFQDGALISRIQADFDEGVRRTVRATPTFFINGRKVEGAIPFPLFKKEVEAALAQARQGVPSGGGS
ncbi:MAG TPA: DsbA family protein [Candidatus Manganitrophaceae bacterium]